MRRTAALLSVALLVAACGSSVSPSAPTGSGGLAAGPSVAPASAAPSGAAPAPSSQPADTPPAATGATQKSVPPPPSDGGPAIPSASADATPSPCQPAGSNPGFWPGIAGSVSWDVYCAVLPAGWFVASGSYRLANGGKLVISYRGPGGAALALSEGSFCTDGSGCVPTGSEIGSAKLGPMDATLSAVDGGGYAIVAARGATPSWLLVTTGLDQATTVSLGAGLAHVTG